MIAEARGKSIRSKLLFSYFLLFSIPLIVSSIIIYSKFLSSYKETSSTMVMQRINQEINNINEALNNIESSAFRLSTNITFNSFLNNEYDSSGTDSFNAMVNRVMPMFMWFRDSNPLIAKINVLTYNESIPEVDMFTYAANLEDAEWFAWMKKMTRLGLPYWEGCQKQRLYRQNIRPSSTDTYSMFCTVEPVYEWNATYLEFQINAKLLFEPLTRSPVGESGYLAAFDPANGILSGQKTALLDSLTKDMSFREGLREDEGDFNYTFNNIRYNIKHKKIKRLNTYILSVVPMTELTKLYYDTAKSFFISIGILLVFLTFVAYYSGNWFIAKVRKITNAFRQFQKGDFETRIEVKGTDELDNLGRDFNVMAANINELINKVYKAEIAQKQAEIGVLQAQIKPHFIYNTLESLRMMAELHDEEEISDGLSALGNLIRQNTNTENHLITIGAEVENLEDYIKILNLTHNNRIKAYISVPEEIRQYTTINLLLQPIVENSIKHGYDESFETMDIFVEAKDKEDSIIFTVRDTGKGIDEARLSKLKELLERKAGDKADSSMEKGIGLLNVNRRIKLYFGDEYGVTLENSYGRGTCAIIKIPKSQR